MLIIVTFNVRHTIPIFFTQAGSRKRTVYLNPHWQFTALATAKVLLFVYVCKQISLFSCIFVCFCVTLRRFLNESYHQQKPSYHYGTTLYHLCMPLYCDTFTPHSIPRMHMRMRGVCHCRRNTALRMQPASSPYVAALGDGCQRHTPGRVRDVSDYHQYLKQALDQ